MRTQSTVQEMSVDPGKHVYGGGVGVLTRSLEGRNWVGEGEGVCVDVDVES